MRRTIATCMQRRGNTRIGDMAERNSIHFKEW